MEPTARIYQAYVETLNGILLAAGTGTLGRAELYAVAQSAVDTLGASFLPVLLADASVPLMDPLPDLLPEPNTDQLKRAWIKTVLADIRVRLLIPHEVLAQVGRDLKDIRPLFETKALSPFRPAGGDPFEDVSYLKLMQTLVTARQDRRIVRLRDAGSPNSTPIYFLPLRFEYIMGTDRFRVHGQINAGGAIISACATSACAIYMRNITDARLVQNTLDAARADRPPSTDISSQTAAADSLLSGDPFLADEDGLTPRETPAPSRPSLFDEYLLIPPQEPLILEISGGRSAYERFRHVFMDCNRRMEFDQASRTYTCLLSYKPQDEDSVVARLLNLVPSVRVLAPSRLTQKIGTAKQRRLGMTIPL
ncbi:MAG: hypothetical protein LBB49_05150 [Gracilibacteraceae bacterium]|jgi:hypothetical protein|nr:hypothetical protein [Gracilibacteraceae bacterium]